ncbi:MAG: DNA repair protein RadC [Lachnospiraceae bacterium]|nr:DNA repair protein RadC [Lachnospiraceae bacterium]
MQTTNRIADMPLEERPYEKCLEHGPRYLTNAELLAIIIRTGAQGERSLDIAGKVLQLSGQEHGLTGICHSSMEQLMSIRGIGKVKAIQLKCIAELSRRFAKVQAQERLSFREPESVADYYMEDLRHEDKELCMALMLDSRCALIKEVHISTGTVNTSLVSPREVYREAFQCSAVNLILMHNHPSGDPTPSREDVALTHRMKECGELLGIPLADHIIIGDNQYASFRELGLLR